MRAVIVHEVGPADSHRVEEVADPVPAPGEVVVDVRAIGVNFPDLLVVEGKYQFRPPPPFSPGKEAAGVITALGAGVEGLRVGERVALQTEYGAYAERIAVRRETVYPMPASMSFEDAAAIGMAYQTAHFALVERAGLVASESVLVTGASGGVGLATVELARALGARVLAGVGSPEKGRIALECGADAVIDLAAANLRDDLRAQVARALGAGGVDIVVDTVGGEVFGAALRALAWRGRLVVVGFASDRIPEVRANYLLVKNIAVTGLQWSDYRERRPEWVARVQQELFALYEAGKLRTHICARYPLSEFAQALARFRRRDVQGKMILLTGTD